MKRVTRPTRRRALHGLLLLLLCHTPSVPARAQQRARTVAPPSQVPGATAGQESDDVVRVNTRVVFLDALVKDKRTGAPVTGLAREDFEVLDDGRPRSLTYFSPGGDKHRPLALVLVMDGCTGSRNVWLEKATGVMERMAATLKQLPPEDEVAVLWTRCGDVTDPCSPRKLDAGEVQPLTILQDLTRDRAAISAALLSVPPLAARMIEEERSDRPPKPKGSRVTHGVASGIACVPDQSLRLIAGRPASQAVLLFVTDDLGLVRLSDRDDMAGQLTRAGVPAHGLVTGRSFFMNLGAAEFGAGSPGDRRANAVQYLAKETGGEAVRVSDPDKYADAFERLIGGLAARYSLGFTLGEDEPADGRLHTLEVKVKARDSRGKERKLVVSAKRGYYAPNAVPSGPRLR